MSTKMAFPLYHLGLTPDELSCLAASGNQRWPSTNHSKQEVLELTSTVTKMRAELNELNTMQQDTMLLCPNPVVNITYEMTWKRKIFNFGMAKQLVLWLNVGNGQTFIGCINNSGNHWVLVDVELRPYKRILYPFARCWPGTPHQILVMWSTVTCTSATFLVLEWITHHPMATSWYGNVCNWRCRNYHLQPCSDICAVNVLINAAMTALDRSLF